MQLQNKVFLLLISLVNLFSEAALATENKPTEAQFVLQKFGLTIGLVFVCILIIFGGLKLYQKFTNYSKKEPQTLQNPENKLKESTNMDEAIKCFLKRTKPNQ